MYFIKDNVDLKLWKNTDSRLVEIFQTMKDAFAMTMTGMTIG